MLHSVPALSPNRFYQKTKDPQQLTWIFNFVHDLYLSGAYTRERGMSTETLGGGKSGKSDIDLWLFKMRMHEYLLGPFLEKNTFDTTVKTQARVVFKDFWSYRLLLKPYSEKTKVDLTWRAWWNDSSMKLVELIEDWAGGIAPSNVAWHNIAKGPRLRSHVVGAIGT